MKIELDELVPEIRKILDKEAKEVAKKCELAVERSSAYLKPILEARTPFKTGRMHGSWLLIKFYKIAGRKVVYITNKAKTEKYKAKKKGKQRTIKIPMTNIIEGKKGSPSKKARPFIRRTIQENREKIAKIFSDSIKEG